MFPSLHTIPSLLISLKLVKTQKKQPVKTQRMQPVKSQTLQPVKTLKLQPVHKE